MLGALVKNEIVENVLRQQNNDAKLGHRKSRVLVLDKSAMEVLNSSCLWLIKVYGESVTLVKDLNKNREPMPSMKAIYIMSPVA